MIKLLITMLCCLQGFTTFATTVVSNPNQTSPIAVTKGFTPSTINVRLTFTASGDGTTTFTLPIGVSYVPGTVIDDNATAIITESNISNLAAPVFSITNALVGAVIISVQVQADCTPLVGTPNINVTGSMPDGVFTGLVSISIIAPAITVTSHAPQTFTRGQKLAVNITVTNGAAGPLDSLLFYIRENKTSNSANTTTDSIKVRIDGTTDSLLIPLLRVGVNAGGDTSFYLIPPEAFSGGALDNGENILVTRYMKIGDCPIGAVNASWGTGFDETYFANYLANARACQSPIPNAPARFNYSNANDGTTTLTISHSVVKGTTCAGATHTFTITNAGIGNPTYSNVFNVGMGIFESATGGSHAGWPTGAWNVDSATLQSTNITYNDAILTASGGGIGGSTGVFATNVINRFNADPDGVNGLSDIDGDGFFDDLAPGKSVVIKVYLSPANPDLCTPPIPKTVGRMWWFATGNNLCGASTNTNGNGGINLTGGQVTVTPLSSPLQLSNGQLGTIQAQISYSAPGGLYTTCTIGQLYLYIPIAPGVTIQAIRVNGASTPVLLNATADTVRGLMNIFGNAIVEFDITVTPGVTPSVYNLKYYYGFICNATCPVRILGCAGVTILVPVPAPCLLGGGTTITSNMERTTPGFTNNTGTTRVNLSTVSPVNRKRVLPCDSVLVTATGTFVAGAAIVGGENFYYNISYGLYGGTDRLFNWTGGTYTINGLTTPLPAPAFEGDINGAHTAIYHLGNGYPVGTIANINLRGVTLGPASLTNQLQQVAGLGNNFFVLEAGTSNPHPLTGDAAFSCNGQLLEFYVREPNASFNRFFARTLTGCGSQALQPNDRFLYLRGEESGLDVSTPPTPPIDYYPGEVRPLVKLDSVSITFGTGLVYVPGTFGGSINEFLRVNGNLNEGGFPSSGSVDINMGTPIVRGNTVTWYNNGSWLLSDDAQSGGFLVIANFRQLCTASTTANIFYSYYGKQNPHGAAGCISQFARNSSTYWDLIKPNYVVTNLSGAQVGDQSQECFDIRVVVSNTIGTNTYIAIPGSGSIFTALSMINTATNVAVPIQNYAGGQYIVLGDLPVGTYNYRLCASYTSCININVPYILSWSCTGVPSNPGIPECPAVTGNLVIQPQPSGIQSQLFLQPTNPINLCDTLKYTVKYTSTLAADVAGGKYIVNVPQGMNLAKVRIRYPSNAAVAQSYTPSTITGPVTIPLSAHTGLVNGIPGINNSGGNNFIREALLELDFITTCDFVSGQSFTLSALGNLPCGAPAQGNGTLNQTNVTDVNGASQEYFSVFGTMNIGADSIITCDAQTVSASVTVFDNPSLTGGALLLPATDSLTITLPQGIRYIPGSYSCTGPSCFLPPIVHGNVLSFPVPAGGIVVPDGANLVIPFTFDIDALGSEGCSIPGKLALRTVHYVNGIVCSTAPGGVCPNGLGFTTGESDTTIVANKAVIGGLALNNLFSYSSFDKYTYDVTFNVGAVPLPAGQNLLLEVFCKSGGVFGATPLATKTFDGPIAANATINFSGFFAGPCNSDSLLFKMSPTTSGGQNQCACGISELQMYAPLAIAKRDTIICTGNNADLTTLTINKNGGTTTYHTTFNNAETGASPIVATVSPLTTTKYYIRNEFSPTIYAIDSIRVTVNPSPDLLARDTAICLTKPVNLSTMFSTTAVTGTLAYFSNYDNALANVSPLVAPTVIPAVTSKYFIRKQTTLGCYDIDSVLITVNPLPTLAKRDTVLCIGSMVDISTLVQPNAVVGSLTYHTTLANANNGTGVITPTVTPLVNTTYYTRRVSTVGSCVTVDSVKVVVAPLPIVSSRDTLICSNDASFTVDLSTLYTSDAQPGFYSYYTSYADAQTLTNALTSSAISTSSDVKYYVRKTTAVGCSDIDSIKITIGQLPLISKRDTTICSENSVDLSGQVIDLNAVFGVASYYASLSNALAQTSALSSTIVRPLVTTKYYVRKQTPTGCYALDSVTINVITKPDGGVDQLFACIGTGATLTGSPIGGTWTNMAGNATTATLGTTTAGVASISFDITATDTYRYIYTANGCPDTVVIRANGGLDYNDLPSAWPVLNTGILSCTNASGVPQGITGAVWAGAGVSFEGSPAPGVTADALDDGFKGPVIPIAGQPNVYTVTMNSNVTGKKVYYGLWFDWNDNGNFADDVDANGNPAFYSDSGVTASPVEKVVIVSPPIGYAPTFKTRLLVVDIPVLAAGYVGNYANGEVEDYSTNFTLPVTLRSFTASEVDCKVNINFVSTTESSLMQYNVEYSKDGITYQNVATIPSKGSNSSYSYSAATPNIGRNYYRLKMIDLNGSYKYSEVVIVNTLCAKKSITAYPNPANSIVNVSIAGYIGKVQLQLKTSSGQLVLTQQVQNGTHTIDTKNIVTGAYLLYVIDAVGNTQVRKINIVH
jgi:hypothetical protein